MHSSESIGGGGGSGSGELPPAGPPDGHESQQAHPPRARNRCFQVPSSARQRDSDRQATLATAPTANFCPISAFANPEQLCNLVPCHSIPFRSVPLHPCSNPAEEDQDKAPWLCGAVKRASSSRRMLICLLAQVVEITTWTLRIGSGGALRRGAKSSLVLERTPSKAAKRAATGCAKPTTTMTIACSKSCRLNDDQLSSSCSLAHPDLGG